MTIRQMTRADLEIVLGWASDEGWNPGLDDAAVFLATDPAGFLLWVEDGSPIAAISVVNHDDANAFLGLYLCHPDWRGKGFGFRLWTEALKHAGNRSIGLDGVAAQQANYAKSGFTLTGSTIRLEGHLLAENNQDIRLATHTDRPTLIALDHHATGYRRENFITAWTLPTATRQTVITTDQTGFATIRQCQTGCKIGPVVANTTVQALALIKAAAAQFPARPLIIDVPSSQSDQIAHLTLAGFVETFRTARMYRRTPPRPNGTSYAIGTMELG